MAYLDKVAVEAEKYNADKTVYDNQDYHDLATMVSHNIIIFRDMFKELEAHKDELNYDDDAELTELEFAYMEHTLLSEMMKSTDYIDGKTLYDFCINYTQNQNDYSDLYPLVAALNKGQIAMTKVAHYYDVVRYSMTLEESEDLEAELAAAEEEYGDSPFNVYEGVDRTIYHGTFALTSAAYRADAFTEDGLYAALFNDKSSQINLAAEVTGKMGAAVFALGLLKHGYHKVPVWKAMIARSYGRTSAFENIRGSGLGAYYKYIDFELPEGLTYHQYFHNAFQDKGFNLPSNFQSLSYEKQYDALEKVFLANKEQLEATGFGGYKTAVGERVYNHPMYNDALKSQYKAMVSAKAGMSTVYALYIAGGLLMLASAVTYGYSIYSYYNPKYDDIPASLVDLIDTVDGDRYIKYDAVCSAEYDSEHGVYPVADLNAFEAERWNAMYYTKSYEAGKPLLADEFVVSSNNNVPAEKYAPVHRFGEVVCYNLNKYNFNDDYSIYLSVKQSDNNKKAVADVPEIIGSVFSTGYFFLAGGVGIIAGAGGTIATMEIIKRRKLKNENSAQSSDDNQSD
jgi:hypothetical protein